MGEIFNGSISYGLMMAVALVCAINQVFVLGSVIVIGLLLHRK